MNSVRFHVEARAELVQEVGFYTAISRRLGERFDKAVKSAVNLAAEFPDLGSPYFFGNAIKLSKPDIMTSQIDSQPNSPGVNNMENFQNLCQHPRKHREFAAVARIYCNTPCQPF